MRIDWSAMDAWFEEDEEVIIHPRDPAARIAILPSSRHVVVSVDGVVVADSTHPTFLHETGLPMRTYLPKVDVRMDLLTPTRHADRVPVQGLGRVLDAAPARRQPSTADLAWSYPTPLRESHPVAGLVAFYDDHVDVTIDGVAQPRPIALTLPRRRGRGRRANPLLPNGPRSALART